MPDIRRRRRSSSKMSRSWGSGSKISAFSSIHRRTSITQAVFRKLKASKKKSKPPAVAPPLVALWHDARGDWDAAHRAAQDVDDKDGAWVHAYLHRKEGDPGNARYWYGQAGKPEATGSL